MFLRWQRVANTHSQEFEFAAGTTVDLRAALTNSHAINEVFLLSARCQQQSPSRA